MLTLLRPGITKLVTQHDHGRMTGELAAAWVGASGNEPCGARFITAATLHDWGWRRLDAAPPFHADTGRGHDFVDLPTDLRLPLYRQALDELADVDPWIGILCSLHYTHFAGTRNLADFQASESARRATLAEQLRQAGEPDSSDLTPELALLRWLDAFSLYMILAAPGWAEASTPPWLLGDMFKDAAGPAGAIHLSWQDPETLAADPFPWRTEMVFELPARALHATCWPDADSFGAAFARAERIRIRRRLVPAATPRTGATSG